MGKFTEFFKKATYEEAKELVVQDVKETIDENFEVVAMVAVVGVLIFGTLITKPTHTRSVTTIANNYYYYGGYGK